MCAGPSNVVSKRQLRLVLKLILDVKVSQVTTPLERVPVVPGKLRRYPIEIEAACSGCSDLGIVCPTPLALSRRRFQSNLIFQLSTQLHASQYCPVPSRGLGKCSHYYSLGLSNIWSNQVHCIESFKRIVRQRLRDQFLQEWQRIISLIYLSLKPKHN